MFEVTAEMIERGRGGDPRIAADRRRVSQKVREARDKLTSSGTGHRAFDLELLRLYALRRRAATPAAATIALMLALIASRWIAPVTAAVWLSFGLMPVMAADWLARRFLARAALAKAGTAIELRRWRRAFLAVETVQGFACASLVLLSCSRQEPEVATFVLIAMLLVAAMSATVTALIPAAVFGALLPMTIALGIVFQPHSLRDGNAVIVMLGVATLASFVSLARKLHVSFLQALTYQAEKDDLIAALEESKANSDLARSRAEESNLAKSRFLATMSHELRTPLNAILGFSEVMTSELFGAHTVPAYRTYAQDIHSSGKHLLMLINEILDLSRIEAGRYELQETSVDLIEIVEECRHLVALRAKKKGIALAQEPSTPLPRLWADARAVRQVTLNLLSNAVKFTPQGGDVTIRLGATADGGQFFSVSDNGPGIPEAEIPVVMSSFGRGTLAQKNAEEGTGLGLPIVRGLVELHSGTFELASKVREGTIVTVSFPPERVMNVLAKLDLAPESLRSAA